MYNPDRVKGKARIGAFKDLGKKHCVFYYAANNFSTIAPSNLKNYAEFRDEYMNGNGKMRASDVEELAEAVKIADAEVLLPADERVAFNANNVQILYLLLYGMLS